LRRQHLRREPFRCFSCVCAFHLVKLLVIEQLDDDSNPGLYHFRGNRRPIGEGNRFRQRKDEAVEQVRGVGDDYHPFDRKTGKPVTAEEVGKRLTEHVDRLAEVVQEAGLGEKAQQAVTKSRTWVATLMGCVAWFWCWATARVQELELNEEQERIVKEKLLAGEYWAPAAERARTAEERKRLRTMAAKLRKEAWRKGGALSSLSEESRKEVAKVSRETAGMFQRSSSCVEGRNGRLSLQHHGHSRVSERRLKALTVDSNHNMMNAELSHGLCTECAQKSILSIIRINLDSPADRLHN